MGLLDRSGAPLFGEEPTPQLVLPADTDLRHDSPHHTLGKGPTQAAAGNHTHDKFSQLLIDDSVYIGNVWGDTYKGIQQDSDVANDSAALLLGNGEKAGYTYLIGNVGGRVVIRPDASGGGSYDHQFNMSETIFPVKLTTQGLDFTECIGLPYGTNLNTFRGSGFFDASGFIGTPSYPSSSDPSWYYLIQMEHSNSSPSTILWKKQILIGLNVSSSQPVTYERHLYNGSWTAWQFTGQVLEYTAIAASGWTGYGGGWGNYVAYCSKNGQICTVQGLAKRTSNLSVAANGQYSIGTLPSAGWYPTIDLMNAGVWTHASGTNAPVRVTLSTAGVISIVPNVSSTINTGQWVGYNFSFTTSV